MMISSSLLQLPRGLQSFTATMSTNYIRCFASGTKRGLQQHARIELKMGVGLRYRRPRGWDGASRGDNEYTKDEVAKWRKEFNMPKLQHSLGNLSYSDEEVLLWREVFDKYAVQSGLINLSSFQKLMKEKYGDSIEEKRLPSLVMEQWVRFDLDGNNFIDFGEFMKASFTFDMDKCKADLQDIDGEKEKLFSDHAEDGFITETGILQIMEDKKFTCVTTSDMRKFLRVVDKDRDGMISQQDLDTWLKDK